MEIATIMDKNLIMTNLHCHTKDDLLHTLSEQLFKNGYISNLEEFINDVYKRESEGQTGIGNYIAVPHSKSSTVKKTGIVIGINQSEIPWESLDGKGAKIVVLFAVGNNTADAKTHLKLLSLFARKLGNDDVINNLLHAESVNDVISAFH